MGGTSSSTYPKRASKAYSSILLISVVLIHKRILQRGEPGLSIFPDFRSSFCYVLLFCDLSMHAVANSWCMSRVAKDLHSRSSQILDASVYVPHAQVLDLTIPVYPRSDRSRWSFPTVSTATRENFSFAVYLSMYHLCMILVGS